MNTRTKWLAAICGAAGIFLFFACNKENSSNSNANIPPGKSQLSVYMTDGPVDFYKVLIDIRQVAVELDTGSAQGDDDHDDHKSVIWDTLTITPGVYDLLQLRNGTDTLLGSVVYPSGKILKVRVWLG